MPVYSWNEVTGAVRPDYDGMAYQERETLKKDAWRRFREATTTAAAADAMEDVIRAHYDRSRETYRGRHPGFDTYACHWVAANAQSLTAQHTSLATEICAVLARRYPCPKVRHIATGRSYWTHKKA